VQIKNPLFRPPGPPPPGGGDLGRAAGQVQAYLAAHRTDATIEESVLRAVDPALADEAAWARIKVKCHLEPA